MKDRSDSQNRIKVSIAAMDLNCIHCACPATASPAWLPPGRVADSPKHLPFSDTLPLLPSLSLYRLQPHPLFHRSLITFPFSLPRLFCVFSASYT